MKLKSILASLSACAIAVSAMAMSASAATTLTNADADENYVLDVMAAGITPTDVYGAQLVIELAEGWQTEGAGGGLIYNSDSTGWASTEWGVSGEGENVKDVPLTVDGNTITFTLLSDTAVFASTDEYVQILCQGWWGAAATVISLDALDASGNVIGETTPAETTTTVAGTDAPSDGNTTTTTTTPTASQTGDAGVGLAVAGLALAGAAAVVTRKKN